MPEERHTHMYLLLSEGRVSAIAPVSPTAQQLLSGYDVVSLESTVVRWKSAMRHRYWCHFIRPCM